MHPSGPNVLAVLALSCAITITCCSAYEADDIRSETGEPTYPGKHPWVARIRGPEKGGWRDLCTGSLIDDKHVLTAASCVADQVKQVPTFERKVWLGCHDFRTCRGGASHLVAQFLVHPSYVYLKDHPTLMINDIALIKLHTKARLNYTKPPGTIGTIKLPNETDSCCNGEPEKLFVTGWGYTSDLGSRDILREAMAETVPLDECRTMNSYINKDFMITERMVCASNIKGEYCRSDHGGPLFRPTDGERPELIGVMAFDKDSCSRSNYIFTRVASYVDWINDCLRGKCETRA